MELRTVLRATARALRVPGLWGGVLVATTVTSLLLGIVVAGQQPVVTSILAQLASTSLSAELVTTAAQLRDAFGVLVLVLIPLVLVLVFMWLVVYARIIERLRKLIAPSLFLPRVRGRLLTALFALEGGMLATAMLLVLLSWLLKGAGAPILVGVLVVMTLLCIVAWSIAVPVAVLYRPRFGAGARTVLLIARRAGGSILRLLGLDLLVMLTWIMLSGFPLFLAIRMHEYGAAAITLIALSLLSLIVKVVHVVAWSVLSLQALSAPDA